MIGAAIGFVFGIAAYAAAVYSSVMPFGQEITSAGITCGILGRWRGMADPKGNNEKGPVGSKRLNQFGERLGSK